MSADPQPSVGRSGPKSDRHTGAKSGRHSYRTKLIQSTTTLPKARQLVDEFRSRTLVELAHGLTGDSLPKPALRTALHGWLGYIDAAILDWSAHHDLTRAQLRDLLLAAFGAAVLAAQQSDPSITIEPPAQPESPKQEALEHASKIFAMESYTFAQAEQLTGTTTWRTPPTSISRAGRPSDTRSTCTEMVMRPRYKRCPSASARASALGCAALMLASCGGGTAGQPARSTATRATPQQEIRVTLAQVQGAFTHLDFKRACSLLVPVSEPRDPRHVFVKPQDLPKWEAVCIKRLSANARRGASAGSFGTAKVQSIAVHGTTAEVSLQGDAGAPIVFVKIAGRWRLGLVGGY